MLMIVGYILLPVGMIRLVATAFDPVQIPTIKSSGGLLISSAGQ